MEKSQRFVLHACLNTEETRVGPGGGDRTLAVKINNKKHKATVNIIIFLHISSTKNQKRLNFGNNNGQLRIATPPRVAHAKPPGPKYFAPPPPPSEKRAVLISTLIGEDLKPMTKGYMPLVIGF